MVHNIEAIWPPVPRVTLPHACYSCGGHVDSTRGFADLDRRPFKGYLCLNCTVTAIGGNQAADLCANAQKRYFDNTGHWPIG